MSARAELRGTRALVSLYCPPAARGVLRALDAIEQELHGVLAPQLEHTAAHARLTWWHEECARTSAGTPAHPLTRALLAAFAAAGGAAPRLTGLVDNALWDLAAAPFADEAALELYAGRWASAFMPALGAALGAGAAPLAALGADLHRLELLLRLRAEALAGRVRLPLEVLGELSPEELCEPRWSVELSARVRAAHARARAALEQHVGALRAPGGTALRPLLVWASLLHSHSRAAAARLPRAGAPRPAAHPLDGWRAWRAARRATRGRSALPAPPP